MDWTDLIARFGPTSAFLFAVGIFFAKAVWPFIVSVWGEQQAERAIFIETIKEEREAIREERQSFQQMLAVERVTRIEERDKFLRVLDDVLDKQSKQLDRQSDQMRDQNEQIKFITNALVEINDTLERRNGE